VMIYEESKQKTLPFTDSYIKESCFIVTHDDAVIEVAKFLGIKTMGQHVFIGELEN